MAGLGAVNTKGAILCPTVCPTLDPGFSGKVTLFWRVPGWPYLAERYAVVACVY